MKSEVPDRSRYLPPYVIAYHGDLSATRCRKSDGSVGLTHLEVIKRLSIQQLIASYHLYPMRLYTNVYRCVFTPGTISFAKKI